MAKLHQWLARFRAVAHGLGISMERERPRAEIVRDLARDVQ